MKKVTYFDVEYANPRNMSICQNFSQVLQEVLKAQLHLR